MAQGPLPTNRHGVSGRRSGPRLALICGCLLALAGCEHLSYYPQIVSGHLQLMRQRQPIEHLVAAETTAAPLKLQLQKITQLRDFADRELALPAADQYRLYADLKRPYVVWNVFAAPAYSLAPLQWCYLVIGCASYRGYFTEQAARNYADRLRARGYDVYVGGTAAYSTLGWFKDPVLNTFVYRQDAALAELIFHELAHQRLYVNGDTAFNESFATVVALEGVKRWLLAQENPLAWQEHQEQHGRQQDFVQLVTHYRNQLSGLYRSGLSEQEIAQQKALIVERMRIAYQQLKQDWGGYSGYDAWFAAPINNAQLNTVATYHDWVPALSLLLAQLDYRLADFYARCEQLGRMPEAQRRQVLSASPPEFSLQ